MQSKELNKTPEVAGSNPVKHKNNYIFLLTFFLLLIGINLFSYSWVCAKHHYQQFFSHTITIYCVLALVALRHFTLIIPHLFFRKKSIFISYQSLSIVCLSVRLYVHLCVTFLVNVSLPKPFKRPSSLKLYSCIGHMM